MFLVEQFRSVPIHDKRLRNVTCSFQVVINGITVQVTVTSLIKTMMVRNIHQQDITRLLRPCSTLSSPLCMLPLMKRFFHAGVEILLLLINKGVRAVLRKKRHWKEFESTKQTHQLWDRSALGKIGDNGFRICFIKTFFVRAVRKHSYLFRIFTVGTSQIILILFSSYVSVEAL